MGLIGGLAKKAGFLHDENDDEHDIASISVLNSLPSIPQVTFPTKARMLKISKLVSSSREINTETEMEIEKGVRVVLKKYRNGDIYDGPMLDGMRHGDDAFSIRADGSKFCGSYQSDEPFQGTLVTSDYTYIGLFRNDLFHGLGTLITANGAVYYGEFEAGLRHGVGKETMLANEEEMEFINANNVVQTDISSTSKRPFITYSGAFYLGKRHGLGILIHFESENCLYSGLFVNGRKAQFKKSSPSEESREGS